MRTIWNVVKDGWAVILFGLFIDALQGIADIMTFAAGSATVVGLPFGVVLGMALNICISLTVGVGFMILLAYFKMFYPVYAFSGSGLEVMPGFDYLPIWTATAVMCAIEHQRRKGNPTTTLGIAVSLASPNPAVSTTGNTKPAANDNRPRVGREVMAAALMFAFMFGGASHAFAQAVPPPVQYVVTPETPGPKTSVTIEVQGVGSFLGDAAITWTQDGKTVLQGTGTRDYTFTTGGVGKKTTIEVAVDSSQGFFSKTFTFNPSKINLVWEADTSVPQWYAGRALYSAGSSYKVVAFPTVFMSGTRIAPSALSYQWSYRGDSVPDASGLGRYVFTNQGDQLQNSEDVGLDVYYGTTKVGTASLSISTVAPTLLLYPRDALRGEILDSALPSTGISLSSQELTVQAEPYYFDNNSLKNGSASYDWSLNGNPISGPDSSRGILTLRQTGQGQGDASLGVEVQNTNANQFVQNASANIRIVFGQQTGSSLLNFFGL